MASWWERKLSGGQEENKTSLPPVTKKYTLPALQRQAAASIQNRTTPTRHTIDAQGQTDMGTAIRMWRGGEAHSVDGHLACPRCGSKNMFSRSNGNTLQKAPAPRCFECGWNGLYQQAEQASWAV
jgi:DNA-directed RNA polymerase subunit RPC12/RpoP